MDNRYVGVSLVEMSSTCYGGKWASSPTQERFAHQNASICQDDEMGSAMTEELTSSGIQYGSRGQLQEPVSFLDWSSGSTGRKTVESRGGLERMGSGMSVVSGFGGDSEELRKCSLLDQGKLPSSQYKGVVPQPNGRWGAQIYEKHQRVWLGTFNREEDAAKAYDRAALKFRGREAITNFRPISDGDPEARFMSKRTKAEIVDMLRKHTYDHELHHHSKDSSMALQNVEEESRSIYQANSSSPPSHPVGNCDFRDHLFDKSVTPSDVGKLNRLVIPKQHAEKYFPMDVSSSEKGLLLNFEDNGGKSWRFRYSYWNSSQSYVLTKGWSRFVKEKKLQAGDIVSFHRGSPNSPRPQQLYITWRRRPCGQQNPPVQSKGLFPLAYGSLNTFCPSQNLSISPYNPQWTHIFWPSSESPLEAAIWPHGSPSIPFYYPARQPDHLSEIPVLINITDPSSGYAPVSLQNLQEKKEVSSSSDLESKSKGVRLFGVNLTEPTTFPGELILFP